MLKRAVLLLLACVAAAFGADPVIGTVTVRPTFASANTPTQVTITAPIADLTLSANGANVQRLNSAGNPTAVLGIMHDDGLNGDAVAGDRIFTLVFTLNEPTPGRIFFRTTAAFQGVLQRVSSSSVAVDIASAGSALSIDATITPVPNAAGWNRADATVTYACAGGAGGSDACPGTVRVTTEDKAQTISGTAADGAGNNATKSVTLNLDKTAPVLSITSPANGTVIPAPAVTVIGTVTDAVSGVATFTCNGQTASVNGSTFSCNLPLVPGANAITVQATDLAGNTATSSLTVTYSASTLTISATPTPPPNAAGWNNSDVTVAFSCSGGVSPVACPQSVVISNEGANQVISRNATDAVGSTATTSVTLKIDKTRPTLAITSPAPAANVTTPQIAVTGTATDALSGLSRVTCNNTTAVLTGANFSCNLTLVSGPNSIAVQATDLAGNVTTSNLNVTLGTALTISATPSPAPNAAGWNNSNVTVSFTCAGGTGTVTCPQPVVVSTEGASQVISRNATDGTGNTATASVTLKIDKTAPLVAITSPASGATVTTAQLAVAGTAADALSGIASATCNGEPATLVQSNLSCNLTLTAGPNTIIVQATDVAGNSAATSIPVTFSTAKLTISASPSPAPNAAGWNNTNVTLTFTCSGGTGTITCPQPVVISTEGANQTVSRTATDTAGNTATASVTLKIDKTGPTVTITSPGQGATVATSPVSVDGTATDTLSGIASATCNGSPANLTQAALACSVALNAGTNTINVQAVDIAGNATTSSVSVTFSPSTLTISAFPSPAPNAAGWNKSDVTVTFACAGGTAPVTCPQPVAVSTEGANQVISRTATDSAGHSATASVTLKIDKTIPVATISSPSPGATITASPTTVTGTVTDALSGIAAVTCNGAAATLNQSNFSCSVALVSGPNTIAVQATDVAGNSATASVSVTFTPTGLTITTSVTPPRNAAGWNNSNASVTFTCVGGTPPLTCPLPVVVSTETAGQAVSGTVTDGAGKTATASVTVKLDKTPPLIGISSPSNGAIVTTASQTISGTLTETLSGIASATCNGSPATVTGTSFNCSVVLSAGSNTITISSADVAGNSTSSTLTLVYATLPTVTFTSPANLSYVSLTPTTVSGSVSDPTATVVINSIPAPVANGQFSVQVPLAEGPNILTATATSALGASGTASIQATLDTTPPHVTITSPPDKFITTETAISIAGTVNDIVVGTVNDQQAQVTVAGAAAQVSNRTFLATNVPLIMGDNVIQAVARDRVGNAATTQITVTRQTPAPGQIRLISGNNQVGTVGTVLPAPLVASITDAQGNPVPNKPVVFKVTQNNGMLASGGAPAPTALAMTNGQGQAQAQWTLGLRAGAGGNTVEAYSVGFGGSAIFTATGNQGAAGKIVVDSGDAQIGAIGQPLPKPLIAVVVDNGNNRLAGIPVTFTVRQGGGSLGTQGSASFTLTQGVSAAGQQSVVVNTDSDGRAAAILALGLQEGNGNNLIEATFPSNTDFPANFKASGRAAGDPSKTSISGVVLDNSNVPIPGVTVRAVLTNLLNSNSGSVQAAASVQTDAQGQFVVPAAPVGFVKLLVDGSTAQRPGKYPTLDYDTVTVAGQNNTLGMPIYLLPLSAVNQMCVAQTTGGGTLTIPEAPGFSLTFGPGQVTFPGGSKTGCVSVTVVHGDKVPMVPGFGQQPRFIVTIQPAGAVFNPPAPLTLPNVDGLKPREVTEMYSFDHDIGSFVAIGTGTVSDDGQVIRSNQGVGVLKAGWHCGGNPGTSGIAATCAVCFFCPGSLASCQPQGNGTACGCGGTCQFGRGCVGGGGCCPTGYTLVNGQCCQGATCVQPSCPQGQTFDPVTGTCVNTGPCPPGYTLINGQCCTGTSCAPPSCPTGQVFDPVTGTCVNSGPCPPGYTLTNGQCCQGNTCTPPSCPTGQVFDPVTGTCVNGPCPPGCSACVTVGGTQQCTQCSNGQPPVNGQCCTGGNCTSPTVTVELSVKNAVVGEALSATAHGSPATNGEYRWQIIPDSGTPSDFVKFLVSPPDNCLSQPVCIAPLLPQHPGSGILRVTFVASSGQQVSADATLKSYHRGLVVLFKGGFGLLGEDGFATLPSLIQSTFDNAVLLTVVPPGSYSSGFTDQELAAKLWLSSVTPLYPQAKVVVFGFSFGGDTATRSTIASDLVISLDPISRVLADQGTYDQSSVTIPRTATNQTNYRQSIAGCTGVPLKGYFVSGATNISLNYLNKGHCDVDDDPSVQQMVVDQIKQILSQ